MSKFKGMFSGLIPQKMQQQTQQTQQTQQRPRPMPPNADFIRRFRHPDSTEKETDELVAVVLTTATGGSYDDLFKSLPQSPGEGQRVAVYTMDNGDIRSLCEALKSQASGATGDVAQMFADVASLDADLFVVNFECCGGCNDFGFTDSQQTMEVIKLLLDRGHMCMCSDFSLKALIASWDPAGLGPNPFNKLGEFSTAFHLGFDPQALANCDSAQLQQVGELCSEGKAHVHAMGGTICYTVVPKVYEKTDAYQLEVLTVVTQMSDFSLKPHKKALCKIGEHEGSAGHVMLTYPSGGKLLTSAGHWVELQRLDTNMESLLAAAQRKYGAVEEARMRKELGSMNLMQQQAQVQSYSRQYVVSSAPCKRSS